VEYTGHVLVESGLSFSEKKKESIVNFKLPENQKELRSFLGLANYFRDHIRNNLIIVHPLHDIVKNYKPKQRLTWSQETKEAFNDIKEAINARSKLFYVDDISPVYLQTDASNYGVGAYLFQVVNDVEHPIMFLSKTFKNEQKRWSAADKECYAIIWAFKELEHLIRDRYFVLRTHTTSTMTSYLEMNLFSPTFPLGCPSHARLADTPPTEMRTRTTHLGALGANHYSALRCGPAVGCEILLWSPTCAGRGDWKQDARMPRSLLDPQRREQLRSL